MTTTEERFWRKVHRTDECWHWTAARNSKGYGCVGFDGRRHLAHRVAYEWMVGPIPEGLTLDHLCANKLCVNPEHLEPVTRAENIARAYEYVSPCRHGTPLVYRKHSLHGDPCVKCDADYAAIVPSTVTGYGDIFERLVDCKAS